MPCPNYRQKYQSPAKSGKYWNQSGSNYRVKSPVKSFRDLEVYQKTIQLSNEITNLEFLNKKQFKKDNQEIQETAESIPKLIAESYGDKFDSKELAHKKLTEAITFITNIITKLDLLREHHKDNPENKEILDKLLASYQRQKLKILNLRKAWQRIAELDSRNRLDEKYKKEE